MPKGKHIPKAKLADIARGHLRLNMSPEEIHLAYFDPGFVTLQRIKDICNKLTVFNEGSFKAGPLNRGGKARAHLLPIEADSLLDLFSRTNCTCLRRLYNEFKSTYYIHPESAPSYQTILRFFYNHRYSRKVLERRHILRDEAEIMLYREIIAIIRVSKLLAIDETASSPDEFQEKYGFAIEGQKAMTTQLKIGNRCYSAIAAYSTRGFRYWKIVEGTTNAEIFQDFLSELEEFVEEDEYCILDNCSIHKTLQSLARLMNVFNDRYKFLPRYSPHWNPIELAFSQIKRYLRSREHIILRDGSDPIAEINQAFFLYSEHGSESDSAAGNWSKYVKNYNFFNAHLL